MTTATEISPVDRIAQFERVDKARREMLEAAEFTALMFDVYEAHGHISVQLPEWCQRDLATYREKRAAYRAACKGAGYPT